MKQLISAKDWRARVPRSQITTRKRASNADDVPKVYTWGKSRLSVQKLLKRSPPKKVSLYTLVVGVRYAPISIAIIT
jgi:hypothetical protein